MCYSHCIDPIWFDVAFFLAFLSVVPLAWFSWVLSGINSDRRKVGLRELNLWGQEVEE